MASSELRRVFEAVCDLPPHTRRAQVNALTSDPALRAEVLALLEAESRTLLGGRGGVDAALHSVLQPELQPGEMLGPWRLVRQIGAGGMGAVFLAERADTLYAQQVAIKLLHGVPDGPAVARLAEERRILATLQHPGIARLYDGGTTPAGQPYLVMEHVDGQPLDVHCRSHQLGLDARLDLIVSICHAVQAAHARLVVHCDLKPGNVLVRADHSPVLLDFGVARLLGDTGAAPAFYTPAYAAPELRAGEPATVASDVFGLGLLLVELLADRPVGKRAPGEAVPLPSAHAAHDVAWRRRLSGDLDAITARACAGAAEDRYPSALALAEDIQRHRDLLPVHARAGERGYGLRRLGRRRWRELLAGAAVLALAAGFVWRLDESRARAEHEAEVARQVSGFLVSMFQAADPRERGARAAEQISVAEVLDRAASRVDRELEDAPVVRARLKGVIGMAYRNMGDLPRALPLLEDAAEALAAAGDQIDEATRFLNMLASSNAANRHGERGEAMARRALTLLGPDWPDSFRVAQSYNSLGLSLLAQQRYDEAEAAFRQALALHEAAGRDQFISVSLDNLGMSLRRRGRLAEAAEAFDRSLPINERLFGKFSFDYWTSHTERSLQVADAGRLEEARIAFSENLARAPDIFGEHSIYYASENARLGSVLLRLGAYREAAPVLDRAVTVAGDVMGAGSFTVSLALLLRGNLAEATGDLAAAEADYRRALDIRDALFGTAHPDSSEAALDLGLCLLRAGRREEGEALVRRAVADWRPRVPADSANAVRIGHGEAELLLWMGSPDGAGEVLRRLAPHAGRVGPEHAVRQRVLEAAVQTARASASAVAAWQAAVDAATALYGADSASTARHRMRLAEALDTAGEPARADIERTRARPALAREGLQALGTVPI